MSSPARHPPIPAPAEPRILDSLADIPAADWDALTDGNPTLSHAWLHSLQETGCANAESGWIPQTLTLWRENMLVAAMPLYVKLHSYGEYVFDWAWADAYERSGLPYFPKLLSAVPFTPCTGSRLMATNDADRLQLLELAVNAARSSEVSSLHILFPPDAEIDLMEQEGLMRRTTIQFHWRNAGFKSFDDYLAAMSHDKRKRIKQERRKVAEAGVTFQHLVGANIREEDWDFFHACYVKTYREHRSTPYLNREFFTAIAERMSDNLLMVVGRCRGQRICAALNLFNAHTLYGRYWGATDFVSGLHFDTCYYQAIQFCIERGIQLFEGGAQGAHKLARGFLPVKTWSAHWLKQPQFAKAVEDYLRRETSGIEERLDELSESSPFRRPTS
ncbi:MAG: N-acetyltransferase [Betaproteobacteria bacterium]|nr:N-acetyltransferase [Betaproteobacteria bacterium]